MSDGVSQLTNQLICSPSTATPYMERCAVTSLLERSTGYLETDEDSELRTRLRHGLLDQRDYSREGEMLPRGNHEIIQKSVR